jgi:pimeloyl-ACP methyl ester carboxylesterase
VPGFTGSKEDFVAVLPLLAERGWSVVTYDQRGQYETPGMPDDDYSLSGLAADAVAVAAEVLGDGPHHLVGHSFGGLVTATAAVEHSSAWASLTLMCSGLEALGDRPDLVLFAEQVLVAGLPAIYAANEAYNRSQGLPAEPADVEAFLRRRFLASSPDSLHAIAVHLRTTPSLVPALAESGVPVRMMRGADDDAWPHDRQDGFAAALGTSVVVLDGAAHSPAVEQPEESAKVLDSFWR